MMVFRMDGRLRQGTEIAARVANDASEVSRVISLLSACGIRILACRHYSSVGGGMMLLVTEDPEKAEQVLDAAGFACQSQSVLVADGPCRFGLAIEIGERLRTAGIAVLHSYSTTFDRGRSVAVFKTADDERSLQVLQGRTPPAMRVPELAQRSF